MIKSGRRRSRTMMPNLKNGRSWLSLVIVGVLIIGHGIVLYYLTSHFALSAAVVSVAIVVVVIKHLGLLSKLHERFRR